MQARDQGAVFAQRGFGIGFAGRPGRGREANQQRVEGLAHGLGRRVAGAHASQGLQDVLLAAQAFAAQHAGVVAGAGQLGAQQLDLRVVQAAVKHLEAFGRLLHAVLELVGGGAPQPVVVPLLVDLGIFGGHVVDLGRTQRGRQPQHQALGACGDGVEALASVFEQGTGLRRADRAGCQLL
ncbi:MAG: hypothetical protein IPL15_08660 [Comamonadaceae bacterium]|nr:hypothetical protein [Comamonadaceae bacterium]